MMRTLATVLATLAIVAGGSLVTAPVAQAGQGEMTVSRAKAWYLHSVCPANRAAGRLNRALFRGRNVVFPDDLVGRRLRQTKRAARVLANKDFRMSRRLVNPPAAWPNGTARPTRRLASDVLAQSGVFRNMSTAANGRQVIRAWNRYRRMQSNQGNGPARTIRVRLNLGPPGRGC